MHDGGDHYSRSRQSGFFITPDSVLLGSLLVVIVVRQKC